MNLTELWRKFLSLDPIFIEKYVAYHYYRSKGWVVRDGVKFGVTYCKFITYIIKKHAVNITYSALAKEESMT